jgi:PhzF family phenazine biosynthesis protein
MRYRFDQLDVFSAVPLKGNPLAVVHAAEQLDPSTMLAFARWTNLSETTFLLKAQNQDADYRVRIFTPERELPFAGHPTLGSCAAWLNAGGVPRHPGVVVQECDVGLVRIRRSGAHLAFAAPPLKRSDPLDEALLARIATGIGLERKGIKAHQWVDNGAGWCAVMLDSADTVLSVTPDWSSLAGIKLGLVGAQKAGSDSQFEVRAFAPMLGGREDPVTGSLNAGLAQWLIGAGLADSNYVAAQGTAIGRSGRVSVEYNGTDYWIGGQVAHCISGSVDFPA